MNPVAWFEIPVIDLNRAKKFYEDVLGLQITLNKMETMEMGWFPMGEDKGYGATGSLVKQEGYLPSLGGVVIYFSVPDIEAALERVKKSGGKVLMPKTAIGEYGHIAQLEDSEGNRVALHTPPPGGM